MREQVQENEKVSMLRPGLLRATRDRKLWRSMTAKVLKGPQEEEDILYNWVCKRFSEDLLNSSSLIRLSLFNKGVEIRQ